MKSWFCDTLNVNVVVTMHVMFFFCILLNEACKWIYRESPYGWFVGLYPNVCETKRNLQFLINSMKLGVYDQHRVLMFLMYALCDLIHSVQLCALGHLYVVIVFII